MFHIGMKTVKSLGGITAIAQVSKGKKKPKV